MENSQQQSLGPIAASDILTPTQANQRIDLMDILRGFALIGILLMNIEWFNRPISTLGTADFTLTGFDHAAGWLVRCFVEGKFYKLFALLFGMGFGIMLLRAKEVGRPFGAWFTRRMLVLMAFGLFHMIFIWSGDILHDYAFSGLVLLGWIFMLRKPRFQKYDNPNSFLKIGLIWLAIPMIMPLIFATGYGISFDRADLEARWQKQQQITAQVDTIKEGLYKEQALEAELATEKTSLDGADEVANEQLPDNENSSDTEQIDTTKDSVLNQEVTDKANSEASEENSSEGVELTEEEEITQAATEIAEFLFEKEQEEIKENNAYKTGTFWQATQQRLDFASFMLMVMPGFTFMMLLPIFFLGYWLIASGKIKHHQEHRSFYNRLLLIGGFGGLFITVAGLTVVNHPAVKNVDAIQGVGNVLFMAGQYLMAAGYLGLVVRLVQSKKWHSRLSKLAPMGRMALTNYIMQSIIQVSIFYGYGAGLYGEVGRASQIGIVALIIIAQIIFSTWWLSRFKFGPLEWLWRSLTYKQWQSMTLN